VVQCRVIYNWYQAGCWSTPVNNGTTVGKWVCCDCGCGPTGGSPMCGCAHFEGMWQGVPTSPPPRPDSPLGGGVDA
jgi:hypothetical protein